MNVIELQNALKSVPDQTLVQYVQNPSPQVPQYLALAELQRRKQMRDSTAAQSAAQGAQVPSVADQTLSGVAALNPQMYAAGGGVTATPEQTAAYHQALDDAFIDFGDRVRMATNPYKLYQAAKNMLGLAQEKPQKGGPFRQEQSGKIGGARAPLVAEVNNFYDPMIGLSRLPETKVPQQQSTEAVPNTSMLAKQAIKTTLPTDARSGLASLWTDIPDNSAAYEKLIPAAKTAEGEAARYKGLVGEDPSKAVMAARLEKMDRDAAEQERVAPWMALANAGLAMAAGKSPNALTNIAEGGISGIKDYTDRLNTIKSLEERRFAIANELAKAQRAEQIAAVQFGVNSEQANQAARQAAMLKQADYQTTRALENAKGAYQGATDAAKLNLDERRLESEDRYRTGSLGVQRDSNNKEMQIINSIADTLQKENKGMARSEAIEKAYMTRGAASITNANTRSVDAQIAQLTNQLKITFNKQERKAIQDKIDALMNGGLAPMPLAPGVDFKVTRVP